MSIPRISRRGTPQCSTTGPMLLSRGATATAAVVDRRLRQSAVGDRRDRRREHAHLSDFDFYRSRRTALQLRIHSVGFLERLQRRKTNNGQLDVRGSGRAAPMGGGQSDDCRIPSGKRHGHLHRPRHRQHRQRTGVLPISPRARFPNTVNFGARSGADHDRRSRRNELRRHGKLGEGERLRSRRPSGRHWWVYGDRTAALAGSFFQGGPTNTTPLYGEMGGSLILNGTNYLGSGIFAARKP